MMIENADQGQGQSLLYPIDNLSSGTLKGKQFPVPFPGRRACE